VERMLGRYPVDGALDLAAVRGVAAAGLGVVGAVQLGDLAGARVLDHVDALDEEGPAQPNFASRPQAEELLGRVLAEVVALDIEYAAERYLAGAGGRVFRVVDGL